MLPVDAAALVRQVEELRRAEFRAGVVLIGGQRVGYARGVAADFFDARKPAASAAAITRAVRGVAMGRSHVRVTVDWETRRAERDYRPFVHISKPGTPNEGIAFQCDLGVTAQMLATPGRHMATMDVRVPDSLEAGTYEIRYGAWRPKDGVRLAVGGAPSDRGRRVHGGDLVVEKAGGKVSRVAWRPAKEDADARAARNRLLGVNAEGRPVPFAGVKTDGSFRLLRPRVRAGGLSGLFGAKRPGEWRIVPLPRSEGFSAELDLARLGAAGAKVASVEALDAEDGAAAPTWSQDGKTLTVSCDARAFAYVIRWAK